MALTLPEVLALVPELAHVVQVGEEASKAMPADVDDATNAVTIIGAVTPPLCALIVKAIKAAKD